MRDFSDFNLFGKFSISIPYSQDLLIKGLKLYLFLFDVVLRVVDAKIVTIDVCFNFGDLLELLEHSVSYIQLPVKLREIVE